MSEKAGLMVEVSSETEIRPLWIRFWFSCEVEGDPPPAANLIREIVQNERSETFNVELPEESPAEVNPRGRVDVRWKDPAVLGPGSRLQLIVWPTGQEKEIHLLEVQRRFKVS
jgi:hypothetical protein